MMASPSSHLYLIWCEHWASHLCDWSLCRRAVALRLQLPQTTQRDLPIDIPSIPHFVQPLSEQVKNSMSSFDKGVVRRRCGFQDFLSPWTMNVAPVLNDEHALCCDAECTQKRFLLSICSVRMGARGTATKCHMLVETFSGCCKFVWNFLAW